MHWPWLLIAIALGGISVVGASQLSLWECSTCVGTPIAVMAYSYQDLPFYVTTEFTDRPEPQITINATGATAGLRFVLGGIKTCSASPKTEDSSTGVKLSESSLQAYFPVKAVPELNDMPLQRIELQPEQEYPIVCRLRNASQRLWFDSHIVRFVKALNAPTGSKMRLSDSDTYRINQPGVDNIRFDDTFGSVSITKKSPIYSAITASPETLPVAELDLRQYLVTTAEWTDKVDTHFHEFELLLLGAAAGAGLACFIEALRPVVKPGSV